MGGIHDPCVDLERLNSQNYVGEKGKYPLERICQRV